MIMCRKLRYSAIAMPMMAAKTVSSRSNHVSLRNPRAMIVNINSAKMTRGMSASQVGISVGCSAASPMAARAYPRRQLLANAAIAASRVAS
jgi:hypothetical protein